MLDPASPIALPNFADVLLYADDVQADAFYAIPARPRIALDDDGRPDVQLTLYGHKEGTDLHVTGGLLTMTTALGLTADERIAVRAALTALLAAKAADAAAAKAASPPAAPPTNAIPAASATGPSLSEPAPPPPSAQLLAIDWATATAEVLLPGGLTLTGRPSQMADNRCSFSASLKAPQAETVRKAWQSPGNAGTITYTVQVRTRGASRTTVAASVDVVSNAAAVSLGGAATATSGGGGPLSLRLSGPLASGIGDMAAHATTITL